jgi:hypothetical protein
MVSITTPTWWEQLLAAAGALARWLQEHEEEVRAWGLWGAVSTACTDAGLYAPLHREAWLTIADVKHGDGNPAPDFEAIITGLYAPGGVGFEALKHEIRDAPLLRDRQREVGEVLDSLADGRNYVAVCGALPLVEYVISHAAGKWNDPRKHLEVLKQRLGDDDLDLEADVDLLLDYAAVRMVLDEIPNVWKDGRQQVGVVVDGLNRQYVLHGTGVGWDDSPNAIRAVLLLAAVARVGGPLFSPTPALPTTVE